jgi:hypothetical protein
MTGITATPDGSDKHAAETLLTSWRVVYVLLAAVVLAVGSEWSHYLPYPWDLIAILWAPWAVAAFVGGRLNRPASWGAVTGIAVVGLGLVSNAAYRMIFYGPNSVRDLRADLAYWAVLTVLVGGLLGAAGAMSRREDAAGAIGWSIGVAVVLAEVARIIVVPREGIPDVVATVDVAIGAAMSFLAVRRAPAWIFLGLTAVITCAVAGLLPLVRQLFPVF